MNPPFDTLVIATRNPAKARWYSARLSRAARRVIGLAEFAPTARPDESGETAEENAAIKANFYARQTGFPVFCEDEALYVDFLAAPDQPGVHVRRINGIDDASDGQLLAYWEKILARVPLRSRTGRWHIAFCIATPHGTLKTFALDIPIRFFAPASPVKIPGWPMSSIQGPVEFNKPHSELSPAERSAADQRIDQAIAQFTEAMWP
jgi:inosine/xanthosine triphosphate pyrophosphatase family protein